MTRQQQTFWQSRIVDRGDVPPGELVPHPRSWRRHSSHQQDALGAILDEVGWVQSVIVSQRTGFMVDGGLRRDIALERGQPTVPVVYVDLNPDEELLVLATFDPIAQLAEADDHALADLRSQLSEEHASLAALLGDPDHVLDLLRRADMDDAPPIPQVPVARTGDLWRCGDHRVLCGDATSRDDVTRLLGGEQARWMWTDPPYGVEYQGGTADRLTIANDHAAALPALLADAFALADEALVAGALIYVAHPAGALSVVFGAAFTDAGWHLHQTLVWLKDSLVLGRSDYHYRHEPVLYGWKGKKRPWHGGRSQTSVFEVPRPKRSPDHPTQKPVALIEAHLKNSSSAGDLGYDPFAGSGSTLVAAHRLGRRCTAMELSPQYVDVVVQRWERASGLCATLDGDGRTFAEVRGARHGR